MSEIEQEEQSRQDLKLPIEWHVADSIHDQYVDTVVVRPGQHEITLFFFETRIPSYVGSSEANREYLLKQDPIRVECVTKMTVAPQVVSAIIEALQVGLDSYNAGKASEEAEEREWDILFAQPHVQAGLDRLAQEAERHYAAGEIEEGGFAVE